MDYGFFGIMDTIFPLMFGAVFLLIVGVMILALVRSASEWSSNNSSPVLSVDARVVSKRHQYNPAYEPGGQQPYDKELHRLLRHLPGGERGPDELRMSGRSTGF